MRWFAAVLLYTLVVTTAPRLNAMQGVDVQRTDDRIDVVTSRVHVGIDLTSGQFDLIWKNGCAIRQAYCEATLQGVGTLSSFAYTTHVVGLNGIHPVSDAFGSGIEIDVIHKMEGNPDLEQRFLVYPDRDYLYTTLIVNGESSVASNNLSPIVVEAADDSQGGVTLDQGGRLRSLFVPFDNDAWVRYNNGDVSDSYEVTALYDNTSRHSIVVGSVTHDTWKTGMKMANFGDRFLGSFRVVAGYTGTWSHDTQPHGAITGTSIASSRIFVGSYDDWRDGLEAYGRANALTSPPPLWNGGPPFGWNSWYPFAENVTYANMIGTSDAFHNTLTPAGYVSGRGLVTINIDATNGHSWTDDQLREIIRHVHANGQLVGTYASPFSYWSDNMDAAVSGTNGQWKARDIIMRDNAGNPFGKIDGGYPLDVSHPATLESIDDTMRHIVDMGFDYVKLDFMHLGSLEGRHYDPTITTGIQAYNLGMKRIIHDLSPEVVHRRIFVSLSIAPIFPNFGDSRRISCDVFSKLSDCEYEMNAVNYGWWEAGTIYNFNDPDMISFDSNDDVARTRINTCIVTGGMMIDGNDETKPEGITRSQKLLCDPDLLALARTGRTFRPVEGDTGGDAGSTFIRKDTDGVYYVAVFNWSADHSSTQALNLLRVGLDPAVDYSTFDLWSKERGKAKSLLTVNLNPGQSKILRLMAAATKQVN